jgi:hypothetical protein
MFQVLKPISMARFLGHHRLPTKARTPFNFSKIGPEKAKRANKVFKQPIRSDGPTKQLQSGHKSVGEGV